MQGFHRLGEHRARCQGPRDGLVYQGMKAEQRTRIMRLLISGVEIATITRVENVSDAAVNRILIQTARAASDYQSKPPSRQTAESAETGRT